MRPPRILTTTRRLTSVIQGGTGVAGKKSTYAYDNAGNVTSSTR